MSVLFRYAQHSASICYKTQNAYLLPRMRPLKAPMLGTYWVSFFTTTKVSLAKKGLNVLFFGVDKYDAVYLKRLISARKGTTPLIRHLAVVTVSPKERVSGSNKDTLWRGEVDKLAEENMLTTHYIHSSQINDWPVPVIREGGSVDTFNIAIVGNFSTQLPQNIVKHFSLGALDIHHSLLPKHRGPMPVEAAIMNNDEVTGVTICEYRVHKFNAGYILAQVPLTLTSTSLRSKIYEALSDIGKELLIKVLNNLDYVRENKIQQDEYEATYTQIYRPPDAKIIWEKMTAEEIVRRHRAFYGKLIMHTIWRKKNKMHPLLLLEMSLPDKESKPISPDYHLRPPGTLFFQRKVPYLETLCIDGSRVLIHKLRIQNRKVFDGPGFKNGYLRVSGALRMLTNPVDAYKPTPAFGYPPGVEPPKTRASSESRVQEERQTKEGKVEENPAPELEIHSEEAKLIAARKKPIKTGLNHTWDDITP